MSKVEVRNLANEKVGEIDLAGKSVFGAPVNQNLLYEAVRHFLAARRSGTHATKNRKLVSGSGKKLWRQKGTGRARIGSIRSPLWRHGGTVHGPQPRSYDYRFPRKMLLGALRSALSAKVADQQLTVIDEFKLESHKTKALREALNRFGGKSVLLVDVPGNGNLERASRNLDGVQLVIGSSVHPYHLLQYERLVISRPAVEKLAGGVGVVNLYQVIRRPIITEKGLAAKDQQRTLCFEVHPSATKTAVKEAVQKLFQVKVESVRTANFPGKQRRRGRMIGFRSDWKKAYVKLRAGEKMIEYVEKT